MKKISLEDQIKKIKYNTKYVINESPKYRSLVDENEEFDEIPNTNEEAVDPAIADIDKPLEDTESIKNEPPVDVNTPQENMPDPNMPVVEAPKVDEIQNDIIKDNIKAMEEINNQLKGLTSFVQNLGDKVNTLNADVEEVREPSNGEKLANKSSVSYPYYFNLNDLWTDNSFEKQNRNEQGKEVQRGIRELPDGTFIADFDDLPHSSKMDIDNSFNDY